MSIENRLNEIDEILDSAWHLPFTGGRAIINVGEIKKIISDIRLNLPTEIERAKNIVSERIKIIDDAKLEADNIRKISTKKLKSMVEEHEIVKNAKSYANDIVNNAKVNSKKVMEGTNQYVYNMVCNVEEVLTENLSSVQKAKRYFDKIRINDATALNIMEKNNN